MLHHLIKCDQRPHLSSPEGLKLSQVSSSPLCQLLTQSDQPGPLVCNLTLMLRACWHRHLTKAKVSFLLSHSLSNPPLQKSLFEFAQCLFHLLGTDEKGITSFRKQAALWMSCHSISVTARCPDCAYLQKTALSDQAGDCCTVSPPLIKKIQ